MSRISWHQTLLGRFVKSLCSFKSSKMWKFLTLLAVAGAFAQKLVLVDENSAAKDSTNSLKWISGRTTVLRFR